MKAYYRRTIIGMAAVFLVTLVAAVLANSAAEDAKRRQRRVAALDEVGRLRRDADVAKLHRLEAAMRPVYEFASAWKGTAQLPEKNAAEQMRSELESTAQRQLGLVTDNAITPQAERYTFQAMPLRVQRVTLRASGKDLAALVVWLGKVEERYPAALMEMCEFSSNVGGNTGLTIRLVQPLHDPAFRPALATNVTSDTAFVCDCIRAISWPQYAPSRIKGAVAVGFQRNPLQPAVSTDQRPSTLLRDPADEITPRLEIALDGRIRSVIRGVAPIVVIDGRVLRIGDELVVGPARERPVIGVKTNLKEIGDDHLVFHLAGGTIEKPIQCDVSYPLPSLLRRR